MTDALEVTVVSMSFVFSAILLLWGVMVLIVRLTEEKSVPPVEEDLHELRKKAAAAAVATVLADTSPKPFSAPPTPIVSAWQAVLRSNKMKERGFKR